MDKFFSLLKKYRVNSRVAPKEPDWNILFNFGLPLNVRGKKKRMYNYNIVEKNILLAINFLIKNKHNKFYIRHYDSFKALLLALKTHYPSKYVKIENDCLSDFSREFDLNKIEGKHIKLRNICLYNISLYFLNSN